MKLLLLVIGFAVIYAQPRPRIVCDFGRKVESVDEVGIDVSSEIPYSRRTRCRVVLNFPENEGFSISCPKMQIDKRGRCRKAALIFVERFNLEFWDRICDIRANGYQLERAGTPGVAYRLVLNFRTARRGLSQIRERGFDCTIRAIKNNAGSSSTSNPASISTSIAANSTPNLVSSTPAPASISFSSSTFAPSTSQSTTSNPASFSSTRVPESSSSFSSAAVSGSSAASTLAPAPTTTQAPSNANGANCQCGVKGNNRIVGGNNADRNEYPWQVTLGNSFFNSIFRFCGGTLITNRHVLTAAHCIDSSSLSVFLGDYNGNDPNRIRRQVSRIAIHPQYNRRTFNNDFAILELSETVPIENPIYTPACLPTDLSQSFEGRIATVTGFGNTRENGASADILQEVQVPVISNGLCNRANRGGITDNMICAGLPQGGKDACQGDSGGPLVIETSANSGKYQIAGVVSFGEGCARAGLYGVYARVTAQDSWIRSQITSGTMCRN